MSVRLLIWWSWYFHLIVLIVVVVTLRNIAWNPALCCTDLLQKQFLNILNACKANENKQSFIMRKLRKKNRSLGGEVTLFSEKKIFVGYRSSERKKMSLFWIRVSLVIQKLKNIFRVVWIFCRQRLSNTLLYYISPVSLNTAFSKDLQVHFMFYTLFVIDNATFIYFSPINENTLFTDIRYKLIVKARQVLRGFWL